MSTIHIEREHQLPPEEIHAHIEQLYEKLNETLQMELVKEDDRLIFKHSGASGFIRVYEHLIEVDISLGLIYRPLRKRIEKVILEYIDDYFSESNLS
ncbi:MAG: polyhydroxyalkanoic acid system family protein [Candidatus Thiodiazotropha sp.]|jgi:putative polyhydroxyalkanoate system protein